VRRALTPLGVLTDVCSFIPLLQSRPRHRTYYGFLRPGGVSVNSNSIYDEPAYHACTTYIPVRHFALVSSIEIDLMRVRSTPWVAVGP
jgi:hypothetical protein